jgi:hypothetical protein
MNNLFDLFNGLLAKIPYAQMIPYSAIVLPLIIAVVGVIFAYNGKRLLNLLKFLVCAGAGYYVGAHIIYGYIAAFVAPHGVTPLIVGIALAVVLLLLSKFAYAIVFAAAFGYVAYKFIIPMFVVAHVPALANPIYLIVAAVAVGVVALIFRGLLETVLTAAFGGAGFALGLYTAIVRVTAMFGLGNGVGLRINYTDAVLSTLTFETVVLVVVILVVAFFGFIKQVKNRHRY